MTCTQKCCGNRVCGFTLIEILVVISVIAILVAIMFPVLSRAKANALNRRAQTEAEALAAAIRAYHTVNNAWPGVSSGSDTAWTNNDNLAVVSLLINSSGQNFYEGIKVGESLRDPFRSNLAYRIVISPANDSVTVSSYGMNCVAGGDDISATQ